RVLKARSARARHWCTGNGSTRERWTVGSMRCRMTPIRGTSMPVWSDIAACGIVVAMVLGTPAWGAGELAVDVVNASEPTLCAEKDNVYLKVVSGEVRRFTIEAVHPAYMGTIVLDRYAPDFRNCDMSSDPVHKFEPRRVTL